MSDSLWPHGLQHARPPCPSPSPGVCSSSCSLHRQCHPAISSSGTLFSFCPQFFCASGTFPMSCLGNTRYLLRKIGNIKGTFHLKMSTVKDKNCRDLVDALEKAMASHSSTLAWKLPWTEEPGGLQSMWSHRVGHDWSDLSAAAAVDAEKIKKRWKEYVEELYKKDLNEPDFYDGVVSLQGPFWSAMSSGP